MRSPGGSWTLPLLSLIAAICAALPSGAAAAPGDLLVADSGGGGQIFRISPSTGTRTTVASGLGPISDIALLQDGRLAVVRHSPDELLFLVDPATGASTPLYSGPPFERPLGVAVLHDRSLLVFDDTAGPFGSDGRVFRYVPATGSLTVYALVRDAFEGAVAPDGVVYVTRFGDPTIFRVDPATGAVTTVATGPPLDHPAGITTTPDGRLLVADRDAGPMGDGAVFWVDPSSGATTTISAGDPFFEPDDVGLTPNGQIYVADFDAGTGGTIFHIDPFVGARSAFATGGAFSDPHAIAVEPPRCRGRPATIVGSTRRDRLVGSRFDDVIVGLRGRDRINGGRGRDLICGGKGKDKLKGGKGKDRLFGQAGRDVLAGGKGRDKCVGGKGADARKSCERGTG